MAAGVEGGAAEGVGRLEDVVRWLMGAPAGVKLSTPLSAFFGAFFLSLINMWGDFLLGIVPWVPRAVDALLTVVAAGGGAGMVIAVAWDALALVTLHVACFHEYAAVFYSYQLRVVASLFRLFLGMSLCVCECARALAYSPAP